MLLIVCLPAVAQNTATTSGNWNNCTTWGSPASILQNNTDTKTINTGVNVVQNTTWSTKTIDFGTGNGSISFASSTNSIDFVTDGGSDQTCVAPVIVGFTCGSASQSGVVNQGTAIPANTVTMSVPYTGGNGGSYPAGAPIIGVSPFDGTPAGLTATLRAGTLTTSTGNLIFDIAGTTDASSAVKFTFTFATKTCTFYIQTSGVVADGCVGNSTGWVYNSQIGVSPPICQVYFNGGDGRSGGVAYKTFSTIAGKRYFLNLGSGVGGGNCCSSMKVEILNGPDNTGGVIASKTNITTAGAYLEWNGTGSPMTIRCSDTSASTFGTDVYMDFVLIGYTTP